MAPISTTEILQAVQNGSDDILPRLAVTPISGDLKAVRIASVWSIPQFGAKAALPLFVYPAMTTEGLRAFGVIMADRSGRDVEVRITRLRLAGYRIQWADDVLNFETHFKGNEGLTYFDGDVKMAEVKFGEWILRAWKKETGLELPGVMLKVEEETVRAVAEVPVRYEYVVEDAVKAGKRAKLQLDLDEIRVKRALLEMDDE
ncbi:hypothetical protein LTR27_006215 [Elasticomyces elasticus]|nr:hypothetical protein LTR27_006215 [Elasticomyces elasticus]